MPRRKVRVTHWLDRWIINPIIRAGVEVGLAPRAFALLETTGRKTGRRRVVPVGNGLLGPEFWIVAQDGYDCAYVWNLVANPNVRVKVPRQKWTTGVATVVEGVDGLAKRREIDGHNGVSGRFDGVIFRAVCTELVTVRIDLDVRDRCCADSA